jgi:glycosyltransferase involved in cell wall biosynthesis
MSRIATSNCIATASRPNRKVPANSEVKIAQVISRLCVGGASVEVVLTTEALMQRGYSTLLLAGNTSADEASLEGFAGNHGVPPIKIEGLSRDISWWKDVGALWNLVRIFRRERPTIIHTHTAKAGVLGRIAACLAGVPIIVHTFHGHVFTGHFSFLKTRAFIALERFLAQWTDCLVAVSESQGRELVDEYQIGPSSKFVTIPVGLELDCLLSLNGYKGAVRLAARCPVGHALVGWVGRMDPVKNPELFVKAAALTLTDFRSARFVMVGDGELRPHVEFGLKKENIGSAVTLLGWRSDLPEIYADLDLVVLTSRHEGTPLVLVEAMASGKPFVATNVGGIRDMVVGEGRQRVGFQVFENGILADSAPAAVAAATRYVLENPEEARAMGRSGRAFASQMFLHHRLANDLEQLYLRLLKQKQVSQMIFPEAV